MCAKDLCDLAEIMPNLAHAEIRFLEIYNGKRKLGTRKEDIDKLSNKWTVNGPKLLQPGGEGKKGKIWKLSK